MAGPAVLKACGLCVATGVFLTVVDGVWFHWPAIIAAVVATALVASSLNK